MDESSNSILPNELGPRSASDRTSAVSDALPAELAKSRERAVLGQQRHSGPIRLCQNEPSSELPWPSIAAARKQSIWAFALR
jgi:hypothetical protein